MPIPAMIWKQKLILADFKIMALNIFELSYSLSKVEAFSQALILIILKLIVYARHII